MFFDRDSPLPRLRRARREREFAQRVCNGFDLPGLRHDPDDHVLAGLPKKKENCPQTVRLNSGLSFETCQDIIRSFNQETWQVIVVWGHEFSGIFEREFARRASYGFDLPGLRDDPVGHDLAGLPRKKGKSPKTVRHYAGLAFETCQDFIRSFNRETWQVIVVWDHEFARRLKREFARIFEREISRRLRLRLRLSRPCNAHLDPESTAGVP